MDGLSEKVPPCFQHFSEQDAKDARNQTTVTGSTTRARGVAFFSVVGAPGGRQPIPSLDPSESSPLPQKILFILRSCTWFKEGPDGKALLYGDGGRNKGAYFPFNLHRTGCLVQICDTQAALYNPWHRSWQLSSLHTGSTSSHSLVFDFKKSLDL